MQNINRFVLDELNKVNKCSAHYITLKLKRTLDDGITRRDVSQNLQQLKKRRLVINDGAIWWSINGSEGIQ